MINSKSFARQILGGVGEEYTIQIFNRWTFGFDHVRCAVLENIDLTITYCRCNNIFLKIYELYIGFYNSRVARCVQLFIIKRSSVGRTLGFR